MSDNRQEILDRYARGKSFPSLQKPVASATPQQGDYKALLDATMTKNARNVPRYEIVDRNGETHILSYWNMDKVVYTPPNFLTIISNQEKFIFSGRGMDKIKTALLNETVRGLYEFNEEIHREPDPEEPKIISLEVVPLHGSDTDNH